MDYTTMTRPGQVNLSGDERALFLKMFSGEILAAFNDAYILGNDKVMIKTIGAGKSHQFPVLGRGEGAKYHTAGQEIIPGGMKNNERVITIDGMMISSTFTDDFDYLLSHYDDRADKARQLGLDLADATEQHAFINMILTSRAGSLIDATATPAGRQIVDADMQLPSEGGTAGGTIATKGAALANAIITAEAILFENNAQRTPMFCYLNAMDYNHLYSATQSSGFSVINTDYGGVGSYADGKILRIGGVLIMKVNTLPETNIAQGSDPSDINYYHYGDFSDTVGVVSTRDCMGILRRLGIQIQQEESVRHQGTLVVARQAMGMGILRPESSVELAIA